MSGVSKTYPSAQQPVLKYLPQFYGAKLEFRPQGSGKSTFKIIAGWIKTFRGMLFSQEYSVGHLARARNGR